MKTKKYEKMCFMAMKLDMSKAHDRVEWKFLLKIMKMMGFHAKWIGWIFECISIVSFSIMVNEEPKGHIVPSRGLRQGLIQNAINEGKIQGFSLSRGGPKISHLFFCR